MEQLVEKVLVEGMEQLKAEALERQRGKTAVTIEGKCRLELEMVLQQMYH